MNIQIIVFRGQIFFQSGSIVLWCPFTKCQKNSLKNIVQSNKQTWTHNDGAISCKFDLVHKLRINKSTIIEDKTMEKLLNLKEYDNANQFSRYIRCKGDNCQSSIFYNIIWRVKSLTIFWYMLTCSMYIMWPKQCKSWYVPAVVGSTVEVGALTRCELNPLCYLKAEQTNVQNSLIMICDFELSYNAVEATKNIFVRKRKVQLITVH